MKRYARPALAVVFVAMLATPAIIRRVSDRGAHSAAAAGDARQRYGFQLTEVSRASGISFVHEAPTLDPKLTHIMPQVASMGAAVAIVDADADGYSDVYVTNSKEGSKNRLYRNRGDGTFEEVAERLGVADLNQPETGVSMGAVFGDYDNDGFEDLFLYRWGRPELFRNEQGRRFTRVTDTTSLPAWANINTAVWLDYDRDGRLDLFLGGYYPERLNLWKLADTKIMPESFEYANNGGRKYLYRNLGGGRFEEVSGKVGLSSTRWALAAVAADLRGTGYPDLFIANDYGVSELFINEGGRFREVGRQTGVGYAPKSGMNASVGDVFNQGKLAVYVSNISEEGILLQGNNLWVPTGGSKQLPVYENMARATGLDLGGWSFGAQFGDLNNDGFLDLYLVNGYVSASRDESYWYDYSKVAGGHQIVIGDAANWPAMGNRSLAGHQPKKVWLNDGSGTFVDVAQIVGATDRHDGRSVALADFGGRGALDVVVANQRGPLLLYTNQVSPERQWIAFELEGGCREDATAKSCSNRSAIGAQVELFWNGRQQLQEVSGGSGFCSQNQRRVHFGLGTQPEVDRAVIRWPSGKTQELKEPRFRTRAPHPGAAMTTRRARVASAFRRKESHPHRQTLPGPDPGDHRPAGWPADVCLPRELVADCPGHRHGNRRRVDSVATLLGKMAAPGERIHLGHQRRHARTLTSGLALRALLGYLDHLEVRAAGERPAYLESFQLRDCGHAGAGRRRRGEPERAMGQHAAADGGGVVFRKRHHSYPRPLSHHAHLCRVLHRLRAGSFTGYRPPLLE